MPQNRCTEWSILNTLCTVCTVVDDLPNILGRVVGAGHHLCRILLSGWKVMYASVQNYAALAALRRPLALVGAQEPALVCLVRCRSQLVMRTEQFGSVKPRFPRLCST